MSRGLTEEFVEPEREVSAAEVLEVCLSVFFAVDALNRKLDAVLAHVGLQATPVQVNNEGV